MCGSGRVEDRTISIGDMCKEWRPARMVEGSSTCGLKSQKIKTGVILDRMAASQELQPVKSEGWPEEPEMTNPAVGGDHGD